MKSTQTQEKEEQKKQETRDERQSTLRGSGQELRADTMQQNVGEQDTPPLNVEVCSYRTHLTQLRRDAPFRPRDWRRQLAVEIARHPDPRVVERLRGWADEWVRELLDLESQPLDPKHPLVRARDLVKPARMQQRLEVQARLLAGQESTAIAELTGVPADTIDWYHAICYHCRDRLEARGWVVHSLLGSSPPVGIGNSHPTEILPWYGFFLGPAVIDLLLDVFRYWEADRQPSRGMTASQLSRRALRLTARASIEARMLPIETLGHADLWTLLRMAERGNRNQVIR